MMEGPKFRKVHALKAGFVWNRVKRFLEIYKQ